MRKFFRSLTLICAGSCAVFLVPDGLVLAQEQPPAQAPPAQPLSPDQLDNLVAPIALYPDNILSQILGRRRIRLRLSRRSNGSSRIKA